MGEEYSSELRIEGDDKESTPRGLELVSSEKSDREVLGRDWPECSEDEGDLNDEGNGGGGEDMK